MELYLKGHFHSFKMNREDYSEIYTNANNLINSAIKVAEINNFGTAISLLVLGLEELIKYQVVLYNTADEKSFTDVEFDKVFKDHKSKHNLLMEFADSLTDEFSLGFQSYVFNSATNQELTEQDKLIKQNRFKEFGAFLNNMYSENNLTQQELKEFAKWLNDANRIKNEGFYVGLYGNNWSFPKKFNSDDYSKVLKFVVLVKNHTEVKKSLDLTDDELIDFLNREI